MGARAPGPSNGEGDTFQEVPSWLRAKYTAVCEHVVPSGYAAISAQYSCFAATYWTSQCHGTRPLIASFTGSAEPHVTPSVERRCSREVSASVEVQPRTDAFTVHMRHAPGPSRTNAGEMSA